MKISKRISLLAVVAAGVTIHDRQGVSFDLVRVLVRGQANANENIENDLLESV
jgi:hypothetical protein